MCGLNTLSEVIDATRVLHEAGSIIYFDRVNALKDLGNLFLSSVSFISFVHLY